LSEPTANYQESTERQSGAQTPAFSPAPLVDPKEYNPETRDPSARAHDAENRRHTLLEKIAFGIAVLAAAGTGYQAYVASDNETRSLRAYLGFTGSPEIHKDLGVWILGVKNGGLTPAHDITGKLNMAWKAGVNRVEDDFSFDDFPNQWSDFQSAGYLLPQGTLSLKFALRHLDIIEQSKTGAVLLIVYGHVDYRDVFNVKQNCQFAYYSVPSNAEFGNHIQLSRHNDCS